MNILEHLNTIDSIIKYINSKSIEQIIQEVSQIYSVDIINLCNTPMGGYSKGRTSGSYYFVIRDLKENIDKYEWLYHRLEDKESKGVLLNLLRYRLTSNINFIKDAFDKNNEQYFDENIIKCDENEVFVDCGAYIGDTIESYINHYKSYKQIYSYEPSKNNYKQCLNNIKKYENIELKQCGVGKEETITKFMEQDSSSVVCNSENCENINIVSIDNDIKEKITYIKMDVEGEEINAILGAKRHIKEDSPKLAICLYHIVSDLWEIPLLIDSINDNYDFYIRHYMEDVAWETVLYAVPKSKITNVKNNKKGFYLIPAWENCIQNIDLTKDVCLIPYYMSKYCGYESIILTDKNNQLQYADKYLKGLKLDMLNENLNFEDGLMNYLVKNHKSIDNIMIFGMYSSYFDKVEFYKKIRPDGKVYLKLDANSSWMDSIDFYDNKIIEFLKNVDIISVESKSMKEYLNKKISYKTIEYVPNGYFDYNYNNYINYNEKENTIITVGRIGTYQKNNEVLLEAFKLVAEEIPNWNLKLIGNIEESFYEYIENYFEQTPSLRSRVIFTGRIDNKEELFNEYKKSKIFVLTSILEGFPNVYSEAGFYGNYIVTSNIDAANDMTNNLKNGDIFEIEDVHGLANILLKRCKDEDYLKIKCIEIQDYIRCYFDYKKIVTKIDYLLKI